MKRHFLTRASPAVIPETSVSTTGCTNQGKIIEKIQTNIPAYLITIYVVKIKYVHKLTHLERLQIEILELERTDTLSPSVGAKEH